MTNQNHQTNKIPQEILDGLQTTLNKVENASENTYEFKLLPLDKFEDNLDSSRKTSKRRFAWDHELLTVIDSYKSTISIEIYDSISEYKDLNGIYDKWYKYAIRTYDISYVTLIEDLLFQKHNEERFNMIHIDDVQYVGNCRKCNKWKNDTNIYDLINFVADYYEQCQVCGELWSEYKYYDLCVDYDTSSIYNNNNKLIAKFKVIRSTSTNSSNELYTIYSLNVII